MTLQQPMFPPRPQLVTVKGKPATTEERAAMTFEPIPVAFQWTNEAWALAHLPQVRAASLLLGETPARLQEIIDDFTKAGSTPDLLESFCSARQDFLDLAKLLDVAIQRSFLVLERLGYGPDNPPPDSEPDAVSA